MASNKTITKKAAPAKKAPAKKAAPKKERKEKVETKQVARHPKARLAEKFGSKEQLAKTIAAAVARDDEDTDVLTTKLKTASNAQLLRLQGVVATVKEKYGSREKLIDAITAQQKKSKDKDYVAKLGTYSLPQLLDLAKSGERAARA